MALSEPLLNDEPTTIASTVITSHHRELRDLLVCPEERGKLFYIRNTSLFYEDILASSSSSPCSPGPRTQSARGTPTPGASSRGEGEEDEPGAANETATAGPEQVCDLRFHPVCLSYGAGVLAAGGLHSELALRPLHHSRWTYTTQLSKSINNSLLLSSQPLPGDPCFYNPTNWPGQGRTRLWVSNNDHTLSAYEVWIDEDPEPFEGVEDVGGKPQVRGGGGRTEEDGGCRMELSGSVRLSTALNHASLSPDGRTMLVVGDTPEVFVLSTSGGKGTGMRLVTTLEAADASFSTSWSPDGRKFAVSSQNGTVLVWDVRSTKPLAKFGAAKSGAATRAVKFTPEGALQELLAFAEGSSRLHVVDARTFTSHKTYTVPPITPHPSPSLSRTKRFIAEPSPPTSSSTSSAAALAAMESLLPIRRPHVPSHILLSSFHLPPFRPSSPPPRSRSAMSYAASYPTQAQLYSDLLDYKPPPPWYSSGYGSYADPEITGLCWDPEGRWLYVGTEGSVVEWEVASQRGWCDAVEFA